MRLDQRVEQLFVVMNNILEQYSECSESAHNHKVHTYQVIPLSSKLGALEWLPDVQTLRQCLEQHSLFRDEMNKASSMYSSYINKHQDKRKGSKKSILDQYSSLLRNPSGEEVEHEMKRLYEATNTPYLQEFMTNLAMSAEAYITLRAEFSNSLASLSICSYILGIGDRHSDNFLIDMKT